MERVFNRKELRQLRQHLRRTMPRAEVILWAKLRCPQACGYRFRRQYSVGPYVIDFYCTDLRLGIEVDGDSHYEPRGERHDRKRDAYLASFGVQLLRFTNGQVYRELDGVLRTIENAIEDREKGNPPMSPLQKGGKTPGRNRAQARGRNRTQGRRAKQQANPARDGIASSPLAAGDSTSSSPLSKGDSISSSPLPKGGPQGGPSAGTQRSPSPPRRANDAR